MMNNQYQSWGRVFNYKHNCMIPQWGDDIALNLEGKTILPFGKGRSYGDSCLNDGHVVIDTKNLNHFLSFNPNTGEISCEAGVTFEQILELVVPHGWFLPVTPGTKFITVGGAIANDVHGKNHHKDGTFGNHVNRFELITSNGEKNICSNEQNKQLFQATIGGLGLTGIITWASFQLKKGSSTIVSENIPFSSLDEFLAIDKESNDWEYSVSWLDSTTKIPLSKGIYMRGKHCQSTKKNELHTKPHLFVPFETPTYTLNEFTVGAFNQAYYFANSLTQKAKKIHYDPFFYPLDKILNWNRIYGRRGLFQYQFVVPLEHAKAIIEALKICKKFNQASFLTVLKRFGSIKSPGMMSFPSEGYTLCLDFPNRNEITIKLFNELDSLMQTYQGKLYPAKDGHMSSSLFQKMYPNWLEFAKWVDPKFSSTFWRRVTSEA